MTFTSCEWNQLWESVYQLLDKMREVRLTLVTVSKDQDLIVISCEFDMAITLFLDCVQRSNLVFTSVPNHQCCLSRRNDATELLTSRP
jgi:hypothetical protein